MVRVPNRWSVRFLNPIIRYVNGGGGNLGLAKGGPYFVNVRFGRRPDTGSPLYYERSLELQNIAYCVK